MIAGEGTQVIGRSARDIYEFVLDFERYKKADLKIEAVHSTVWRGEQAEVHYSGRFRGLPTPSVRHVVSVQPYRRIDVRSKPGTLAHLVSRFHGIFTLEQLGGGATRVYHREELEFAAPFKWFIEPLLRSWLEADTPQEVERLKMLLEAGLDVDADRKASWPVESLRVRGNFPAGEIGAHDGHGRLRNEEGDPPDAHSDDPHRLRGVKRLEMRTACEQFADKIADAVRRGGAFSVVERKGHPDARTVVVGGTITSYVKGNQLRKIRYLRSLVSTSGATAFDATVEFRSGGDDRLLGTMHVDKDSWPGAPPGKGIAAAGDIMTGPAETVASALVTAERGK
jgi:hypothetical protein